MSEFKFCKDCIHYIQESYPYRNPRCKVSYITDLVRGTKHYDDCKEVRQSGGSCGVTGRLFELRIEPERPDKSEYEPQVIKLFEEPKRLSIQRIINLFNKGKR